MRIYLLMSGLAIAAAAGLLVLMLEFNPYLYPGVVELLNVKNVNKSHSKITKSYHAKAKVESRPRVLIMSEAFGYGLERLGPFCFSANKTCGPIGSSLEVVLIDPSYEGGRYKPLQRREEFREVLLVIFGGCVIEFFHCLAFVFSHFVSFVVRQGLQLLAQKT